MVGRIRPCSNAPVRGDEAISESANMLNALSQAPMPKNAATVVVVGGGGVAGLCAAYELQERGFTMTVQERYMSKYAPCRSAVLGHMMTRCVQGLL